MLDKTLDESDQKGSCCCLLHQIQHRTNFDDIETDSGYHGLHSTWRAQHLRHGCFQIVVRVCTSHTKHKSPRGSTVSLRSATDAEAMALCCQRSVKEARRDTGWCIWQRCDQHACNLLHARLAPANGGQELDCQCPFCTKNTQHVYAEYVVGTKRTLTAHFWLTLT